MGDKQGRYPPFSPPSEPLEYVATTDARMSCEVCGEWIYTVRPAAGGPSAFPSGCQVCGAPVSAGGVSGG